MMPYKVPLSFNLLGSSCHLMMRKTQLAAASHGKLTSFEQEWI
jgi:hypothetical protein